MNKFLFGMRGLFALIALLVSNQAKAQEDLYQVHGSGTSNPAPLIWKVGKCMYVRAKCVRRACMDGYNCMATWFKCWKHIVNSRVWHYVPEACVTHLCLIGAGCGYPGHSCKASSNNIIQKCGLRIGAVRSSQFWCEQV